MGWSPGPILNPAVVYVVENGTFVLTCATSQFSRDSVVWLFNQNKFTVQPTYKNESCAIVEGSAPTGAILTCSGYIYNVIVTNITRDNNGDEWRCKEFRSFTESFSNAVTVVIYGKRNMSPYVFFLNDISL